MLTSPVRFPSARRLAALLAALLALAACSPLPLPYDLDPVDPEQPLAGAPPPVIPHVVTPQGPPPVNPPPDFFYTPTPIPTATPAVQPDTLPQAKVNPELLDLSDPALYAIPLTHYTASLQDRSSGEIYDGSTQVIRLFYAARFQLGPKENAWYIAQALYDPKTITTQATVGDRHYAVDPSGACLGSPAAGFIPAHPMSLLNGVLAGQARRVETELLVNGLLVDRYEITPENIAPGARVTLEEKNTGGSGSLTISFQAHSGSLYLAQQGGFVVRLVLADPEAEAGPSAVYFRPGTPVAAETIFNLVPTRMQDGALAAPQQCGGPGTYLNLGDIDF